MPRLGHKKSRNGCRQCKARHVKCDESRPCSNCARHSVLCSLVDPDAPLQVPAAAGSGSIPKRIPKALVERPSKESVQFQAPGPSIGSIVQPLAETTISMTSSEGGSPSSSSDSFPFISTFVRNREPVHADLWLRDLELMHHWMVQSIDSLSQRPDIQHTWRVIATKLAADYAFFMHEILAFAALHLAILEPDKRKQYFALGTHHQDQALRGIQRALANVTNESISPIFATSFLITISVWASRGQDAIELGPHAQDVLNDLLDIFALQSGVGRIMETHQLMVLQGPLAQFFKDPIVETPSQPLFHEIIENLPTLTAAIEKSESIDEETRRDLLGVVAYTRTHLLRCCRPCEDNREMKFLFSWPIRVSQQYMNQLRQRDESALAVFGFYSVGLYAAEPKYWFMRGWADRTMRLIAEHIKNPDWKAAVAWPLQFMERQQPTPPMETKFMTAFAVE